MSIHKTFFFKFRAESSPSPPRQSTALRLFDIRVAARVPIWCTPTRRIALYTDTPLKSGHS